MKDLQDIKDKEQNWWENNLRHDQIFTSDVRNIATVSNLNCRCGSFNARMVSGEQINKYVGKIVCPDCTAHFTYVDDIPKSALPNRNDRAAFENKVKYLFIEQHQKQLDNFDRKLIGKWDDKETR